VCEYIFVVIFSTSSHG